MHYTDIIRFWFKETSPRQWFTKDKAFDEEIRTKFLEIFQKVVRGETKEWREVPEGRLAEIIVLDQFSRNMFRDTPEAFKYDQMALSLAQEAVRVGDDKKLTGTERYFIYVPYMHSESRDIHKKAIWFFLSLPFEDWWSWIKFEFKHKKIIDHFGRYPHRNKILGRISTPEEVEFLKKNSGF